MTTRVAAAIFIGLILAVTVGWLTAPRHPTAHLGPAVVNYAQAQGFSMPSGAEGTPLGIVAGFMVAGAAVIGVVFFAPRTPRGPRLREISSAARHALVAHIRELEIVLELLQTVDERIYRLSKIQTRQYVLRLASYH
ncbi:MULTISPECIES: hypothetical protein [unclassified Nocardia]|uniref:hypothetical protein n=1 Tax=unclassified Nocardia TaxID=2637762 RepID=UPI001CE42E5F|nr:MULTISPECIES: hypothetical protein [unclassified Nocardia]